MQSALIPFSGQLPQNESLTKVISDCSIFEFSGGYQWVALPGYASNCYGKNPSQIRK